MLATPDLVLFGRFRLEARRGVLSRQDAAGAWAPVAVGSRALDVLGVLVERHGELVPKDEIMRAVWPGTTVEEKNLAVQISALRRVLDEGRAGESCIQTVPGRGYRLIRSASSPEEVRQPEPAAAPVPDGIAVSGAAAAPARSRFPRWRWLTVALGGIATAALVLVVTVTWQDGRSADPAASPRPPAAPRLSLVVLPFKNLSGDRSEDYLADAITDDVTTDLSSLPGTFVIARQSAYTYRGRTVDVRKVGEELGVRYVVEGSVRKLGDVLRVNVQLVSTETGAHLRADRFDQPLKDLSAGQEEIVGRIGHTLNVAIMNVEGARGRQERPTNPDAFDLIIRARSIWLHPMGPRERAERRRLYEEALRLDPTALHAMTGLAGELIHLTVSGTGDELGRAAKLLADAAAINPHYPYVLEATAFLRFAQGRYVEAVAAYQRLQDEYPNYPIFDEVGWCLLFLGRAEEAISMMETALRRDPRNPFNFARYSMLGFALLMLGRDEDAVLWTQRALAAAPPDRTWSRAQYNVRFAAAHARLGRPEEARRALVEANRLWPYDTVRTHWPEDPSSRTYAAQVEHFQGALRLAGHRDHAEEDADFGVSSDDKVHQDVAGLTPTTVPGATTIRTAELERLLAERRPVVIDPLTYSWGRSIPGAVGLRNAGLGSSASDAMQDRLRRKMQELTKGDLSVPVVAVGFNSERFDGRNLALRLVALGYTNVYWYRGGREAWEVNGLREAEVAPIEW